MTDHVWRSKPVRPVPHEVLADPNPLGYFCEIRWECAVCESPDPEVVCEEALVDLVHAL